MNLSLFFKLVDPFKVNAEWQHKPIQTNPRTTYLLSIVLYANRNRLSGCCLLLKYGTTELYGFGHFNSMKSGTLQNAK